MPPTKSGITTIKRENCEDYILCELCQSELKPSSMAVATHMNIRHRLSMLTYRAALRNGNMDELRIAHGYTTKRHQCGWCLEQFNNPYKFGRHRNRCHKRPNADDDRTQERNNALSQCMEKLELKPAQRNKKGFNMKKYRKLQEQGGCQNSMIKELKQLDKINELIGNLDMVKTTILKLEQLTDQMGMNLIAHEMNW